MSKFFLFIRHAFALICEDKRFSAIYIAGTSVAIASAMAIAIVLNILLGDIPPESNRSRTLYFNSKYHYESKQDDYEVSAFLSFATDSCLRRMKCVEAVSADDQLGKFFCWDAEKKHGIDPQLKRVQPDFFRIYDFDFVSGRPFSEKEFRNGKDVCILTEEAAKKLALTEDKNTIFLDGAVPFHVVGIVKTPSFFSDAAADIYTPYLLWGPTVTYTPSISEYTIDSQTKILLRKGFSRKDFLEEFEPHRKHIEAMASRRRGEKVEWTPTVKSYFFEKMNTFNFDDEGFINQTTNLAPFALLLLLFLFLPALNLSGLVSNRMEVRRAEMGIRKAFGARRHTLLREIVNENLVLTLCGGLLGWALSWAIIHVYLHSSAAYTFIIREFAKTESPNMRLDIQAFVTPTLFLVVFLCCVVLNLMAALIPAWFSLRKPIVDSLNQKR